MTLVSIGSRFRVRDSLAPRNRPVMTSSTNVSTREPRATSVTLTTMNYAKKGDFGGASGVASAASETRRGVPNAVLPAQSREGTAAGAVTKREEAEHNPSHVVPIPEQPSTAIANGAPTRPTSTIITMRRHGMSRSVSQSRAAAQACGRRALHAVVSGSRRARSCRLPCALACGSGRTNPRNCWR